MKNKIRRIAIFVPHRGCPHDCVFCNQRKITGQTEEMTAHKAKLIIEENLKSLKRNTGEKPYVEIAFFGGSFTAIYFEKQCELLEVAKEYIDSGDVDAIRCSTRPDAIDEKILDNVARYGMTAIELGVQSADEEVLAQCERGHTFDEVKKAAQLIKEKGFNLGLQQMTGLPGGNENKDIESAMRIAALKPDCVRIYPTLVMEGTKLMDMYKEGDYIPQTVEEAVNTVAKIIQIYENENIEIMRIGLQTTDNVNEKNVIGPYHPAFAELCYGRIKRMEMEKIITENSLRDCALTIKAPKSEFSKIIGHKKENYIYFKNKYNVDIVLEEIKTPAKES